MNKSSYTKIALECMPTVETHIAKGSYRHDVVKLLDGSENIGIELGVASGLLSKRLLETNKFKLLFGVDVYGDIHDTIEYKNALNTIGIAENHKLIRLTFDDAADLFPNDYFDFIYIDGFAHTGEEGGKTLVDWYGKLKVGGIMSGDDYHTDWPLVMWAVNHFASQLNVTINLTERTQTDRYSLYPTWFFRKESEIDPSSLPLDGRLVTIAKHERTRIHRLRMSPLYRFLHRLLHLTQRMIARIRPR